MRYILFKEKWNLAIDLFADGELLLTKHVTFVPKKHVQQLILTYVYL